VIKRKKSKKKQTVKAKLKRYKKEDGSGNKETLPEKLFRELLQSCNLSYHQEYKVAHKQLVKSYDFCIFKRKEGYEENVYDWRLLVEVHGDYWHSWAYFEGTKKRRDLSKVQKKNLRNDLLKRKIANLYNFPILYIWEHELKNNYSGIKKRLLTVLEYIKNSEYDIPQYIIKDPYIEEPHFQLS
jgi:hypothetical protein